MSASHHIVLKLRSKVALKANVFNYISMVCYGSQWHVPTAGAYLHASHAVGSGGAAPGASCMAVCTVSCGRPWHSGGARGIQVLASQPVTASTAAGP